MQRLTAADYLHMPWKNGGGVTEQIAISPPGATVASGFAWRVSRARVTSDGPFSLFPGHDRILVICAGGALELARTGPREDETLILQPLTPFAFAGEAPIVSRLTSGEIADFNVIYDRAFIAATCEVRRIAHALALPASPAQTLVHGLRGTFVCGDLSIGPGDTLLLCDEVALLSASDGPCIALEVQLRPRTPA